MATSLYSRGVAAAEGSSSSGVPQSYRPCALALPNSNGSTSPALSSSTASTLLDELAEVACSPQSPLMKAVQAVWPDFNLSPLETKAGGRRGTPPATQPTSPLKHNGHSRAALSPSKSKSSRTFTSRTMSAASQDAIKEYPVCTSREQVIEQFAEIPFAALRCFQTDSTMLSMYTPDHGTEVWVATQKLRDVHPPDMATSPVAKDLAEMTRLLVVDCHTLGPEEGEALERVKLTFRVMPTSHQIVANCFVSHPFLVEKKGWTSLEPESTLANFGLSCQQLSAGDLCVPPVTMEESGIGREEIMPQSGNDSSEDEDLSEESDDTEESKAARLLSQLAQGKILYNFSEVAANREESPKPQMGKRQTKKRKHDDYYDADDFDGNESDEDSGSEDYNYEMQAARAKPAAAKKKPTTVKKVKGAAVVKKKPKKSKVVVDGDGTVQPQGEAAKRPMNAFMLFAQKYRQEVTREHPGKDNRAISTLLGTYWKELDGLERKKYVDEARVLAQEHQRRYPNCWKRKSTNAKAAASKT